MRILLKVLLAGVGMAIVFLGLNIGLGGIQTLGWQGGGAFITVSDADVFAVRDNHIRFIGGVWLGVGLLFLGSAFQFARFKPVVIALCAAIFVGGLTRLSIGDVGVVLSSEIAPSSP